MFIYFLAIPLAAILIGALIGFTFALAKSLISIAWSLMVLLFVSIFHGLAWMVRRALQALRERRAVKAQRSRESAASDLIATGRG